MFKKRLVAGGVLSGVVLLGCVQTPEASEKAAQVPPPVVDIVTREFSIAAPPRIPSGWTTFRLENKGEQEHFAYIYRLPGELSFEQFRTEAMEPFGAVWEEYVRGDLTAEEAGAKFGEELPDWFFTEIVPSGGPALTEPGETSQATLQLNPGTYVIECYVKMPDGGWHTEMGMQRELTVTAEETGAEPPRADVEMMLSNYEVSLSGPLSVGPATIAVHATDTPDGFMQHDINLFRLDDGVEIGEIVAWMDWMDLTQFRAPAPGYSLGGMEHQAAGSTGYITVDLQPGRYAWVSEGYADRGMVEAFTIE